MNKLSIGGMDSTLGNWRKLCSLTFGKDSKSVQYFQKMIEKSPLGENEEVIAAESQVLLLVLDMEKSGATDG